MTNSITGEYYLENQIEINGVKQFEINGIRFCELTDKNTILEMFDRRDYEFGSINQFVVIDVGANTAVASLYFANDLNCKKIYAFEPFLETIEIAKKNIQLNPNIADKIIFNNYGLSNEDKLLKVPNLGAGSAIGSTSEFFYNKYDNISLFTKVEIKKASKIINKIIESHNDCSIILKVDTEGAEYEIFEDLYNNNILKDIDIVFLEWHEKGYKDLIKYFECNNFVWFHEKFSQPYGFIRAINIPKISKQFTTLNVC